MVDVAQLVRVSGCGPEGRRFESGHPPQKSASFDRSLSILLISASRKSSILGDAICEIYNPRRCKKELFDMFFKAAVPVWAENSEKEINLRLQFKATVPKCKNATVCIATSGMYQLWVNGSFVAYGPARAGKKHFRVDEIALGALSNGENSITIEVAGYNTNAYAMQNQASFLQAEILDGETVVACTGKDFSAIQNPYYYQKIQRYSFQRPMAESYDYTRGAGVTLKTVQTEAKQIIKRYAPYPEYEKISAVNIGAGGFELDRSRKPWRERSHTRIGSTLVGFTMDELDAFPTDDCAAMAFSPLGCVANKLCEKQYAIYKLPYEASGFLKLDVSCKGDVLLYVMFDELLCDGKVSFTRMDCANAVKFVLPDGEHSLQLFEVYSMQYVQIAVVQGDCTVNSVSMTELKHPPIYVPKMKSERLQKIADAAANTFRQNAVDIFMDCPSRERAGWLCDSFFSGRTEAFAAGNSLVEKSFLENFLHEESYGFLPEGMLPMCYPADHYDRNFIPQWAMWLVLQLAEYKARSGDSELVESFKTKIEKLLAYLEAFENSDGLLENLQGWNFVEWSKANELTKGVNYPTNMLYSAALNAAAKLYCNEVWAQKSEKSKQAVLKQSYNGSFFVDNATRENGSLKLGDDITEVCQYYAFFLKIATEQSHKELFDVLINEFGPNRRNPEKWAKIHPAAPFIGYFLRLDILAELGKYQELAENIEGYYLQMAEKTGTLWEHANESASCCHGFSGYILCWLDKLAQKLY